MVANQGHLNSYDISCIQRFLDNLITLAARSEVPEAGSRQSFPLMADTFGRTISPQSPTPYITSSDLIGLYRYLAPEAGRNEALFKVSLRARDTGWNVTQTVAVLVDIHVQQHPNGEHRSETDRQRSQEAECTIRSAFSRSPRSVVKLEPCQLPNVIREALFGIKQTYTVRVLEGLRLRGIQPGQSFTAKQAVCLLEGIVGRDLVYKALNADVNPSPRTLTHANAAKNQTNTQTTKCFVVNSAKPGKSPRHRPACVFMMPGNTELAAKLGVKLSRSSDPVTEDDLRSAKKVRQAVHRELIKRRPGQYPARWLAARLGVSVSTEQRYNREIPITVVPMYIETPIFWWNLGRIPADMDVPGLFLQDEKGKRYPARRPIACKLLGKGQRVSLMRRGCNYYSYGERLPFVANTMLCHKWQLLTFRSEGIYMKPCLTGPVEQMNGTPQTIPVRRELTSTTGSIRVVQCSSSATRKPRASQRKYRKPLEDIGKEALAQRLYALVGALSPGNHVSETNARKLVDQYDSRLVESALKRVGRDQRVYNPAGFIITYLRSEAKAKGG